MSKQKTVIEEAAEGLWDLVMGKAFDGEDEANDDERESSNSSGAELELPADEPRAKPKPKPAAKSKPAEPEDEPGELSEVVQELAPRGRKKRAESLPPKAEPEDGAED